MRRIAVILALTVAACSRAPSPPRPSTTLTPLRCAAQQDYSADILGGGWREGDHIYVTFNTRTTPQAAETVLRACFAAAQQHYTLSPRGVVLSAWTDDPVTLSNGTTQIVVR